VHLHRWYRSHLGTGRGDFPVAEAIGDSTVSLPLSASMNEDDVRDVLGELANMVAGNLKSLLPKGVDLSIPTVVEGRDYSLHVCGGNIVERSIFTGSAGDFCVTVIELLQRH
jgi:chemotaxis protein CheX